MPTSKPKKPPVIRPRDRVPLRRGPKSKWGKVDPMIVAKAMGELGATDEQLASALGYTRRGVRLLKARMPKLVSTLNTAKAEADAAVEKSLYKRATGYECPAIKFIKLSDDTIVTKHYIEHYPPDTTAGIFWLKNRKPAEWRDRSELGIGNTDGTPIAAIAVKVTELEMPKPKGRDASHVVKTKSQD